MRHQTLQDRQKDMSPEEVRIALGFPAPAKGRAARSGGRWEADEDGLCYMLPPGWVPGKAGHRELTRSDERCLSCGRIGEECRRIVHDGQVPGSCGPSCEWCPSGSGVSQG